MWQNITHFLFNNTPLLYWTQSLWRDEAFSVWISQSTLAEVIQRTSGDFNPPLYYLLLNLWMKLFGNSEVALRGMSLMFSLIFLIVVYYFAKSLFKSERAAVFTTIFMAVNPMLLYFAFELRMYSLLVLFATLSMYFLHAKNWKWYIVASTLGMYTQPFMAFVILSQCVYMLLTKQLVQLIKNGIVIGLLYLPWVPTLLSQFRASGPMWMYPVDLNLISSVLGNLFFGYEGTPGNLWKIMQITSLIFILATIFAWKNSKSKSNISLLLCWVFVPCVSVLTISLLKPVYVHRYLIFVSVGEVFLLSASLLSLKQKIWKYRLFGTII
ncbi:glycosyltransferase family 39 protein, partial [Deltaproteobacteria bacterium TL4]